MTDDETTTIRVTALDRELAFEDREELADHVAEILEHRGAIFDPLELAAIQTLASVANGGAPERVHRISRQTAFHAGETDADAARADTPFGERIEELDVERQERAAELDEARAALEDTRRELGSLDRRKAREGLSRAERRKIEDEIQQLRRQLHAQNEAVQDARRAAFRATAAWNKCRVAADRWRRDREARFVVGPPEDRRTVDREGLMEWLDRQ